MPWTPEQRVKYAKPDRRKRDSPKDKAYSKAYYRKHKTKFIQANWKRQIGLLGCTENDYQELLAGQNFVCAICSSTNPNGRRLAVDHDHKTGKIRGLLCQACNRALGLLKDNLDIIERAKDYLCHGIG